MGSNGLLSICAPKGGGAGQNLAQGSAGNGLATQHLAAQILAPFGRLHAALYSKMHAKDSVALHDTLR